MKIQIELEWSVTCFMLVSNTSILFHDTKTIGCLIDSKKATTATYP